MKLTLVRAKAVGLNFVPWSKPDMKRVLYQVLNATDQILASPEFFSTTEQAEACIATLRKRFEARGYYLTADGVRIKPEEVELLIAEAD